MVFLRSPLPREPPALAGSTGPRAGNPQNPRLVHRLAALFPRGKRGRPRVAPPRPTPPRRRSRRHRAQPVQRARNPGCSGRDRGRARAPRLPRPGAPRAPATSSGGSSAAPDRGVVPNLDGGRCRGLADGATARTRGAQCATVVSIQKPAAISGRHGPRAHAARLPDRLRRERRACPGGRVRPVAVSWRAAHHPAVRGRPRRGTNRRPTSATTAAR